MSQEWVTRPERSNVWTIRFIVWFALVFGRRASRSLLYPISIYFIIFSAKARTASRKYLDRALGHPSTLRDGFRHCFFFASTILDRVFLLNDQISLFDVRTQGEEIFREIKAKGRGCLLIGAHMGSFEVIHALSRDHGHPRTSLVMYEENARKLNAVLDSINPQHNRPVIPLGKIDSMLRIQEALQRGEYIGILADRTISGKKMVSCDFLGGQINLPITPFRLAVILNCPVVFMLGIYQGGNRYDVSFEYLVDPRQPAPLVRDLAIKQTAQQFATLLERHCREAPYNWFNFYDVWN
ncbi:MAG TPA: acyl-CoA synthetase [Gallionella sp.]|nr:acyl-CoA synthetase [Gallionella sp.]